MSNVLFSDGGCQGNGLKDISKRKMIGCFYDEFLDDNQIVAALSPGGSNNISEILAVYSAMKYAIEHYYKEVVLYIDSWTAYWWITRGIKKSSINKINDYPRTQKVLDRINKMKPWFRSFEIKVLKRELNKAGVYLEEKTKDLKFI